MSWLSGSMLNDPDDDEPDEVTPLPAAASLTEELRPQFEALRELNDGRLPYTEAG